MSKPEAELPRYAGGIIAVDDTALHLIDLALEEDRGAGDWTSRWTSPARTRATARITARTDGISAGVALAHAVFLRLDPRVEFEVVAGDGAPIAANSPLCAVRGPGRALLTGEMTALGFLRRLSGIATLTRRFVDAVEGTGARILDTRHTTPGWRTLERGAVRAGGGENHRFSLADAAVVKRNHAAVAGGLAEAIRRVQDQNTRAIPVMVEASTQADLDVALEAGADRIVLRDFSLDALASAVRTLAAAERQVEVEATGHITLENVRAIADTGVPLISVMALTHPTPVLDLTLRLSRP